MNQNISYRDKSQMRVLDVSQVDVRLTEVEFQSDERTAYITEQDKCIGIVTENDFLNHKWRGTELINKDYMSIGKGSAPDILIEKGIRSLPVISGDGCLIGEYYLEQESSRESHILATDILPKLHSYGIHSVLIEDVYESYKYDGKVLYEIEKTIGGRHSLFEEDESIWEKFLGSKELAKDLKDSTVVYLKDGFEQYVDCRSKYMNRVAGERYTCGNPEHYENTIYFFGPCLVNGHYVKDEDTICSLLRSRISRKYYIKNCGNTRRALLQIIKKQHYRRGDIVVIFLENSHPLRKEGFKVHPIIEAWYNVPNLQDNVWDNLCHVNKIVNCNIAEEVWKIFQSEKVLEYNEEHSGDDIYLNQDEVFFEVENAMAGGVKQWLDSVAQYKASDRLTKCGGIVMNCNPFTNGHRYLIEEALKIVELIYIFVVEENKSYFAFNDRIAMVREGVKDLENVIVIPSGKYIISTHTLPGYFEKDNKPYVEFDAAEDLEIFAKKIAPNFGITVRFAGEEPNDPYTRSYNRQMRELLPQMGIEFIELPRKSEQGVAISASNVRKLIKEGQTEAVKKLVPETTLEYLRTCKLLDHKTNF